MKRLSHFLMTISAFVIVFGFIMNYQVTITKTFNELTEKLGDNKIEFKNKNDYYRNYNFSFVQDTTSTSPSNYQELLNTLYTILNRGYYSFTFYCSDEYDNCVNDITSIANDQELLSTINNYVHPFNSFSNVEIGYNTDNMVMVSFNKNYSNEDIDVINPLVNTIFELTYNPNDTLENNILAFHDYIINNTKYDSNRSENNIIDYRSDIAYGTFIDHYALCGGYSDAMALFLEKMGIKNFKVASSNHVWNAVYLNDNWYNLDLTWDDPVTPDNRDILDHSYFLVSTDKLLSLDTTEHTFESNFYKELKNS